MQPVLGGWATRKVIGKCCRARRRGRGLAGKVSLVVDPAEMGRDECRHVQIWMTPRRQLGARGPPKPPSPSSHPALDKQSTYARGKAPAAAEGRTGMDGTPTRCYD